MNKQEWEQCTLHNKNRLSENYYVKLDNKIKKKHTYIGKDKKINNEKWNYINNGNWTTSFKY